MSLQIPVLQTPRLRLRAFAKPDTEAIYALLSSSEVLRYWDAPPWREYGQAERFIATCGELAEGGSGARLVIERASDEAFIGWCCLANWNPEYRSAKLGYCLGSLAWGHGFAAEAAQALLGWSFDTLPVNRVQAETDTRNLASARVLEKLGFVHEGTLREDCIVNGEKSDTRVYGLLRRGWRAA